jgi:hypothetical protein
MSFLFKKSDGKKLFEAAKDGKGEEVERLLKKGVKPDGWKNDVRRLCPPLLSVLHETQVTHPRFSAQPPIATPLNL